MTNSRTKLKVSPTNSSWFDQRKNIPKKPGLENNVSKTWFEQEESIRWLAWPALMRWRIHQNPPRFTPYLTCTSSRTWCRIWPTFTSNTSQFSPGYRATESTRKKRLNCRCVNKPWIWIKAMYVISAYPLLSCRTFSPRRTGPNWTVFTSVFCVPAAPRPAPPTGGTGTST